MAAGEPSTAKAQSAAFAGETEAYNDAHSLVSTCHFLSHPARNQLRRTAEPFPWIRLQNDLLFLPSNRGILTFSQEAYRAVCKALAIPPSPPPSAEPLQSSTPTRPFIGPERPPAQNIYEPHDPSEHEDCPPANIHLGVPAEDENPIGCNSAPFIDCFRRPRTPGTKIGRFEDCHLIAEGLASKVYRLIKPSACIALKVTEPHPPAPHNPHREAKIMYSLTADKAKRHENIIVISDTFYDQSGNFVIVMPYFPITLSDILEQRLMNKWEVLNIFEQIFSALAHLHKFGIIHRDIKPSNIVSSSRNGPIQLIDFGTAWDPLMSLESGFENIPEPADSKIIEVGTGPYRAPETLFGNKAYDTSLDMWSAGCVLAEALSWPTHSLFSSPPAWEDGNQLGLIVSIFKTLGTPTPETWPEALEFPTKPFGWYNEFPAREWDGEGGILPARTDEGFWRSNVEWSVWQGLVRGCVKYESGKRYTAQEVEEWLRKIRVEEGGGGG